MCNEACAACPNDPRLYSLRSHSGSATGGISLKFYPREDLTHQHLLRFAEAASGQLSIYDRETLEEAKETCR